MSSRQIVFQLILLVCLPLHQSLLLSSNSRLRTYSSHKCNRNTALFAGRNPFQKNESSVNDSAAELPSKSALFSSSNIRRRSINFSRNEGISSNDMHPDDVGAVRNASVLGGILSIVFTRDIWYAVSSFLLINIFASQSNPVGVFIRSIGQKMDNIQLEISRKKMMLRIVNFLKAVNEASSLRKAPSKQKIIMKRSLRTIKIDDSSDAPAAMSLQDSETVNRSSRGRNYSYFVSSDMDDLETDQSDGETDAHISDHMASEDTSDANPASKAALRDYSAATVISSHGMHSIESSPADTNVECSTVLTEPSSTPDAEHNSEAVIRATIEIQAAADAASARLKSWLQQQKVAEEEKKMLKLSIVTENIRVLDLPRLRDELLLHMSTFVSGNISERKSLTVATANTTTASTANSSYPVFLTSFSCRAIESSAGSINDFILVLTSPGRNSLKQRYRELAKEFHPDSGTNVDLPDSTVNSLMANLTGAFNYLSGVNSLSPDGQTLMSAQSPWGLKYTGSTVFDQSTGTSSVPVTCSHTLSHSHIEEVEEEEGDSSRGDFDVSSHSVSVGSTGSALELKLKLELNLESELKSEVVDGVDGFDLHKVLEDVPSALKIPYLTATALKHAGHLVEIEVKEESVREMEGGVDSDVKTLSVDAVFMLPSSLTLTVSVVKEDIVNDRDRHGDADGGGGMRVMEVEGKMVMMSSDDIGCHHVTSAPSLSLSPPLPTATLDEVEKEVEMWSRLPTGSYQSDVHSDSVPSKSHSAASLNECRDVLENDHLKMDSHLVPNDHVNNGDKNSSNNKDSYEAKRVVTKDVTTDFSTPYQSKQQVLMWKSWGKDIDWSKMKFQGNSDIYTKAQESLSKNGGKVLRNARKES